MTSILNLFSAALGKENATNKKTQSSTTTTRDVDEQMRLRIQPTSYTRHGPHSVPVYLYLIVDKHEWMQSASKYTTDAVTKVIHLCDEDRLDGMAARNYFRKEFEEALLEMNTFGSKFMRAITDALVPGRAASRRVCGNLKIRRPSVNQHEDSFVTHSECVLIVVVTNTFEVDGSLNWKTPKNYPQLTRAIDKTSDVCVEYPLRFDKKTLHVLLPADKELAEKAFHYSESLCAQ